MTSGLSLTHLGKWGAYLLLMAALPLSSLAQIGPPPVITIQPASLTVTNGGNATFTVTAISATKIWYQWRFNGTAIPGAGKSSYTHKNVNSGDAGNYSVVVQNASGSVTSSNALLTVLSPTSPPPPLRFILTQMTTNGFQMRLSGPSGTNYVIYASTDLQSWTPIATNSAPAGIVNYTDPLQPGSNFRFYRAKLQ